MKDNKSIILVPTDFSEVCDNAIKYAAEIAKFLKFKLALLHIVTEETMSFLKGENIEKWVIKEMLESKSIDIKSSNNVEVDTIIAEGDIFEKIPKIAKDIDANFIVLGTHGKVGFQKITGSFALRVITSSPIPTIVVQKRPFEGGYKNIVLPITNGLSPVLKTEWAAFIAKQYNSTINIFQLEYSEELNNSVSVITDYLKRNEISFTKKIANTSSFTKQVIQYATSTGSELILIMTNPDSQLKKFVIGSYDEQIIFNTSQIPVMCINPR